MTKDEKRAAWDFILGIQKIDDYEPTEEYKELIEKEINGEINTSEMKRILIEKYRIKE